jgi:hypothetical protein
VVGIFFTVLGQVEAKTITAANPSLAAVSTAIASAVDGDTVIIPVGTATWTSQLVIPSTKSIAILGPESPDSPLFGTGQAVITDNTDKSNSSWSVNIPLSLTTKATGFPRISGIRFQGGNVGSGVNGMIHVYGTSPQLRIDHCIFTLTNCHAITVEHYVRGVIDHCTFDQTSHALGAVYIHHNTWNIPGSDFGDASRAAPSTMGTADAMYVEDSTFTNPNASTFCFGVDGWMGSRMVIRHCALTNVIIAVHGTDSGDRYRGARHVEWYNNTIACNGFGMNTFFGMRGGTGVIFNNTITKTAGNAVLAICTDFRPGFLQGIPYDPWGISGSWNITSLTRSGTTVTVTVAPKTISGYTAGHCLQNGKGEYVRIRGCDQSDYNGTFPLGQALNSTQFTYQVSSSQATTGTGAAMRFSQPWDGNTDQDEADVQNAWGYPCFDQNGRGQGALLSGVGPNPVTPVGWPNQVLEPWYIWGNTINGVAANFSGGSPVAKLGRDIFNAIKPGYAPYTYPHPLVSGATPTPTPPSTLSPPTNLQITGP